MTADQQVRELVDRFWEGLLEREPLLGTYVGDERYDDRLPDLTETGRARRSASSTRSAIRSMRPKPTPT